MAQNNQALLTRLQQSKLEFVIIGGVSAVFHGAPLTTFDLDICCPFGEENVRRIEAAVGDLHPVHRLTTNRLSLAETRDSFASLRNLYLQTDLGKLDCLSDVAGVGDYSAAWHQSIPLNLSYGHFRILNLDALIASKSAVGREKDLEAVRLLQAIKEKGKSQS